MTDEELARWFAGFIQRVMMLAFEKVNATDIVYRVDWRDVLAILQKVEVE